MSIRTILENKDKNLLTLEETETVLTAVQKMNERGVGSIIVLSKGKLAGIFTERDLLKLCAKSYDQIPNIQLKDVMTRNLTVASPDDNIDDILATMVSKKFRHMPVMEGDKIIGLISIGDAVKDKMEKAIEEANLLRQYISG